jgi:hypothetical protein
MSPTKPWYTSLTVWGAVVSLIASGLSLLDVHLDETLRAELAEWLLSLATLVGGAAALYGRLRATRRLVASAGATAVAGQSNGLTPPPSARKQNWRMNNTLLGVPLLLLSLHCTGCSVLTTPAGPYVAADRATYDAVAPEYRAYVANDPGLDEEQRARRGRTVESWRVRVESAEGGRVKARRNPNDETRMTNQ